MWLYFLCVRIAALFGNKKAKLLVKGQSASLRELRDNPMPGAGRVIWFHAASVGEFEQARPIIERLRAEQPSRPILLTFFSPSGYCMRCNYDRVDKVVYLPFATRRHARQFLDAVQPEMAIFVKYEFWPAYLRELKKRGIATYSISAIFRPKQAFFRAWGRPYLRLLKSFTRLYVQDEASAELLRRHDVEQVEVAGDTRFDRVMEVVAHGKEQPAVETFVSPEDIPFPMAEVPQHQVIVAGSTWPQDEQLLARYIDTHPAVKLVLVPHEIHEEHLHQIFQMFHGRYVRFTEASMMNVRHTRVMVVDTMGLLSSLYRYGQVAYIGGGFGVGIHNTIEAAAYGMPVLFGPNYHNFREACGLIDAGAACSISNYQEFEQAMDNALMQYEQMGAKAQMYVQSERGATDKIYGELFNN